MVGGTSIVVRIFRVATSTMWIFSAPGSLMTALFASGVMPMRYAMPKPPMRPSSEPAFGSTTITTPASFAPSHT